MSCIHIQRHLSDNKLTENSAKDVSNSSNHTLFSVHYSEDIERAIVFDTNSTLKRIIAYCSENSTLQSMTVWINDVKAKDWRQFTLMTTTILRWYFQKKTFQNDDKTEKTKDEDLIYVYFTYATLFTFTLQISDIKRSISKLRQSVVKQKVLIKNFTRRIRYSIFITRHSTQTKIFRTTNSCFEFDFQ